jgi:DNA ligase-1
MRAFAILLDQLYFTYGNNAKLELIKKYFAATPDPERGFALAIIAGTLKFPAFSRTLIRDLMKDKIDPVLFDLSYDYVGDLSETVSLLWPDNPAARQATLPALSVLISECLRLPKTELKNYLADLLDRCSALERWALLKLGTGSMRIGVSARFLKQALAGYGDQSIQDIEQIWHALQPPYTELFAWLERKTAKPNILEAIYFHPVMLAHPLDDDDMPTLKPEEFAVERKFDGIRVQIIITASGKALYSRTGDDISGSFPDALAPLTGKAMLVIDGELLVQKNGVIGSFNDLQQRLGRKNPSKKLLGESPAHIIVYDILFWQGEDLRSQPFVERRQALEKWFAATQPSHMSLSPLLACTSMQQLVDLRRQTLEEDSVAIEGLMLKRKDSNYIAGRPTGLWYKWKRDPHLIDAILMYAQRGHGKRSSYYSDYTFGLWQNNELLPIGKAYSGFTDAELMQLDKWIRHNTIARFGPVREVKKELVLEVAFDAVNYSSRHKSGIALRFPRINRIRWDKPAAEVDSIAHLKKLIEG